MATVCLSIEPELCGPVSIGTVAVIKLVREHLGVSLAEAMDSVNRCVFDNEEVELGVPSADAAARFVDAIAALPPRPRISAEVRG